MDAWAILRYARRQHGGRLAVVDGPGPSFKLRTYEQLYARSCLLAASLLRHSLGRGDRVRGRTRTSRAPVLVPHPCCCAAGVASAASRPLHLLACAPGAAAAPGPGQARPD
jgi:acyl-CoA synthetase (AMP-forming)/AMP-acid ligase II